MRSFSLGLCKGSIDQVDGTVRVTWVQPRVLDKAQLKGQCAAFKSLQLDFANLPLLLSVERKAWGLVEENQGHSCYAGRKCA